MSKCDGKLVNTNMTKEKGRRIAEIDIVYLIFRLQAAYVAKCLANLNGVECKARRTPVNEIWNTSNFRCATYLKMFKSFLKV